MAEEAVVEEEKAKKTLVSDHWCGVWCGYLNGRHCGWHFVGNRIF